MKDILVCSSCSREYAPEDLFWRCPSCGSYFNLRLDNAGFSPDSAASGRGSGIWSYRSVIPVKKDSDIVSFCEEKTPLSVYDCGGSDIFLKLDYLFPSGSYKDRGAAVMISKAKELGIDYVVEDSSGNAGASVAAYCAKGGIRCSVYVPASNSEQKLSQIKSYGASLVPVEGSRAETSKKVLEAAEKHYYASHIWNPYFYHGTKTFAYEVCEQLGWKAPDTVILPVGHGTLFLGSYIGFKELYDFGVIRKIPRFIAVQAAKCSPLSRILGSSERGGLSVSEETLAEGIAITNPVRINDILTVIDKTDGNVVTVSEKEIKKTLVALVGRGYYTEPTSAAAVAGAESYLKNRSAGTAVSVLTGSGLKAASKIYSVLSETGESR